MHIETSRPSVPQYVHTLAKSLGHVGGEGGGDGGGPSAAGTGELTDCAMRCGGETASSAGITGAPAGCSAATRGGAGGDAEGGGTGERTLREMAAYSALPEGSEVRASLKGTIVQEGRFLTRVGVVRRSLNAAKRHTYQSRRHDSLHTWTAYGAVEIRGSEDRPRRICCSKRG